jgi:hypothetical protein
MHPGRHALAQKQQKPQSRIGPVALIERLSSQKLVMAGQVG